MMYFEDADRSWENLAKEFILEQKNNNLKNLVKHLHNAKMRTERKMRRDLDQKIIHMRTERLSTISGKDFAQKLKDFARLYAESDIESEHKQQVVAKVPPHM